MTLYLTLWVLFGHWIADFVCQSHWMSVNKSKNWWALTTHVSLYTLLMTSLAAGPAFDLEWSAVGYFAVATYALHFTTDAITSRVTSRLYRQERWHDFFVVIGFDQFLHYTQLLLTLAWL